MSGITDACVVVDKPIELGQAATAYKSPYSPSVQSHSTDPNTVGTNATVSKRAVHLQNAGPQGVTKTTDITSSEEYLTGMEPAPGNSNFSATDVTLETSGGAEPSTMTNCSKRSATDAELKPNFVSAKRAPSGLTSSAAGLELPISLQHLEVMEINGYYLKKIVRDLTTERAENLQIRSISGRHMEPILLSDVFEKLEEDSGHKLEDLVIVSQTAHDQMKRTAITMTTRAEEAETQVNQMAETFEGMRKDYAQLQARNRALDAMLEERYGRLGRIYDYDPEVSQDPNHDTCACCRRAFD